MASPIILKISMAIAALLLLPLLQPLVQAAPNGALVSSLPGFNGTFPSNHYAGYITVDEHHGRQLYYYFVTSSGDPKADPLVLWMNGGPGCSSFDGFIYEHGPFSFEVNASGGLPSLSINPYSWTTVANVLYLDSPAGVGFAYSNVTSDYVTGDLTTARDVHTFLLKWFEEYAEYQLNPFFVSGESYAGVYVPTVVKEVADGIRNGSKPPINLKGYLIGNGVTDEVFDGDALVPFAHGMGLISEQLYEDVSRLCNSSYWNATESACATKLVEVDQDISSLNLYDILEPCYHDATIQEVVVEHHGLPGSFRRLGETERSLPTRRRMFGRAWPLRSSVKAGHVQSWSELGLNVPCMDFEVASRWLNDPSVREAIHAFPASAIGTWVVCSEVLHYDHDAGSMLPYHKDLLESGYRALIYSGDHDMCVPFTGSEAWTKSMGYEVIEKWRPWFTTDQVSGYTIAYANNLTFATIKAIPSYRAKAAHHLCKVEEPPLYLFALRLPTYGLVVQGDSKGLWKSSTQPLKLVVRGFKCFLFCCTGQRNWRAS